MGAGEPDGAGAPRAAGSRRAPDRLRIRTAGPPDAEAIEGVRRPSWRAAYAGLLPASVIEEYTGPDTARIQRHNLSHLPGRRMLVAELDGVVVGFAAFGPERAPGPSSTAATVELYALYVRPDHWSTGIGRALIDRVLAEATAAGHDRLSLWVLAGNTRARVFYEHAGFAITGEWQRQERLGNAPEIRYAKAL